MVLDEISSYLRMIPSGVWTELKYTSPKLTDTLSKIPLIEAGQLCSNSIQKFAQEYLTPLFEARVEAIILGCSHYPLISTVLEELIPKEIRSSAVDYRDTRVRAHRQLQA